MIQYDEVFPKMPDDWDESLDDYVEYMVGTWCCNSLNSMEGLNRRQSEHVNLHSVVDIPSSRMIVVDSDFLKKNANYLSRAQSVIWYLLEENKKLKERSATNEHH